MVRCELGATESNERAFFVDEDLVRKYYLVKCTGENFDEAINRAINSSA